MDGDAIPADVREFILRYIESIAELEALLLLRREAHVLWHEQSLGQRLYIPEQAAGEILGRLAAIGFLSRTDGKHQYRPRTDELRDTVDRLAAIYAIQLIPVTNLIHSKPSRIREFADAFKLRKDS
jgi:hypothetical protein